MPPIATVAHDPAQLSSLHLPATATAALVHTAMRKQLT
jgi:hypothetical protein